MGSRFELRGPAGDTCAALFVDGGAACLEFYDPMHRAGAPILRMTGFWGHPELVLRRGDSKARLSVSLPGMPGRAGVLLEDDSGTRRIQIDTSETGNVLRLFDEQGGPIH